MTFQFLSRLPGGQSVYHAAQHFVTGSSRQTDGRLMGKIQQTIKYWEWLAASTPVEWLRAASHLDLGTGWLPSVPMTFHALGISRQYLVDISPHLSPEAVVDTAEMFRSIAPQVGIKFPRLPVVPRRGLSLAATLEPFGMTYAAPYDDMVGQIAGSVDFATATHMMLHLNRATMLAFCRSVHKLLKPGGYFLAQHHLRQLFDGLLSKTSPFFALRYSDWFWENSVNSPMMSYNRLRAPDYREILEESGFELAHLEVEPGRPEDFALLERAKIHPKFMRYTEDELAARAVFFVARKAC